ncbi:MAG: TonB-dependent receptor [bacterium]|nr:TonB-dependent receptor [bacterium]
MKRSIFYFFVVLFLCCGFILPAAGDESKPDMGDVVEMSLDELLNVKITSASNRAESVNEAPATVIVISRKDIEDRGYLNMMEMLSELPGMEMVISKSADGQFKNYWRGFRSFFTDPYLLMVDGLVYNNLYYGFTQVMATFPLSNVERVEVVYGPASSIYGANAFNGVINIITKKDAEENGSGFNGNLTAGDNKNYIGDVNFFHKHNLFRVSLTVRMDNGDLRHDDVHNNYEYSKDRYASDRAVWGGFVDNSFLGRFTSPFKHRGIDLRGYFGNTEFGFSYYAVHSGFGYAYPGDKGAACGLFLMPDTSFHLRHTFKVTDKLSSKTLIRYRTCETAPESVWVESYNSGGVKVAHYSLWQLHNSSWTLMQDFDWEVTPKLSLLMGLKYEQKELQKAQGAIYGPTLPVSEIDAFTYEYPEPSTPVRRIHNLITTEDKGLYVQGKYMISDKHHLHGGIRVDDNSVYGTATVLRAGYVGKFGKISFKALYGEAYQEPTPRVLFGAWMGAGSDVDLKPERSRTLEFSLNQGFKKFNHLLSVYFVKYTDTILNFFGGARNQGERNAWGVDYHFHALLPVSFLKQLKLWGYYSYIHAEGDEVFNSDTGTFDTAKIGDLAPHKFYIGATAKISDRLTSTLRARYIHTRETVHTNPIKEVESYFTADFFLGYKLTQKLSVSLKVDNIFDSEYYHPGIRSANAGDEPGYIDAGGVWQGSKGWYNSLLPQPGRTMYLSVRLKY